MDMVEQAGQEEERRERERALIEEGRWLPPGGCLIGIQIVSDVC